ncbi:MAG: ATP-dependent Clp protease proteolytic subunit [Microcystaceae cyanobacterium]
MPSEETEKVIEIKQPPVLFKETQTLIQKISNLVEGVFISYQSNARGLIHHSDVIAFYELLEKIGKQEKVYLFIKSNGGNGQASLRMVNLIRQYCQELVVLIPLECASAATMVALGANEIRMGPMAYLTAVDTSLIHDLSPIDRDNNRVSVSLDELMRVVKRWQKEKKENDSNPYMVKRWQKEKKENDSNPYHALFPHVHPLVIGAVDRAESLSIMLCKELLSYHITEEQKAEEIAKILNSKYPSHDYPILLNEANKIGLNVKEMDREVNMVLLELNKMYCEMGQKAVTDFDQSNAHSNEILKIIETNNEQIFYQEDKDWFYREDERRWITLNDNSSWRKMEQKEGEIYNSVLHIE